MPQHTFTAKSGSDAAEISIYDEIGFFGVSAKVFREALSAITAPRLVVNINSPGGDVFDGIAMYNDLLDHPAHVTVRVTGLAASAASVVAMAGDEIEMADNAFLMVHNAWALVVGNKNDMRQFADTLDEIDKALARTYAKRGDLSVDLVKAMMDAETWLGAEDAEGHGLIDRAIGAVEDAVLFDIAAFANAPPAMKQRVEAGLRAAGYSKQISRAAVADGFDLLGRWDAARADDRCDADTLDEVVSGHITAHFRQLLH